VTHHDAIAVEDFKPKFLARTSMARKAADAAVGATKRALTEMGRKHGRDIRLVNSAYTTMDASCSSGSTCCSRARATAAYQRRRCSASRNSFSRSRRSASAARRSRSCRRCPSRDSSVHRAPSLQRANR